VALAVRLRVFEGPLDLLLHLIREAKIDIYDIPIAEVTGQYLEMLALLEELDLEVAGEFLVMAATLMEIKSRMLLPRAPALVPDEDEGDDPRSELVQRLLEYEQYKQGAEQFRLLEDDSRRRFTRGLDTAGEDTVPLEELQPDDLLRALRRMLASFEDAEPPVASLPRERISLRLRMRELWGRLQDMDGPLAFRDLFLDAPRPSRLEVIVTFLAVLELLRLGRIRVTQPHPRADLLLFRREEPSPGGGGPSGGAGPRGVAGG
jgi:segregation and condensation protein A